MEDVDHALPPDLPIVAVVRGAHGESPLRSPVVGRWEMVRLRPLFGTPLPRIPRAAVPDRYPSRPPRSSVDGDRGEGHGRRLPDLNPLSRFLVLVLHGARGRSQMSGPRGPRRVNPLLASRGVPTSGQERPGTAFRPWHTRHRRSPAWSSPKLPPSC